MQQQLLPTLYHYATNYDVMQVLLTRYDYYHTHFAINHYMS